MAVPVVLDTCVLYPAYLRDTVLRLANEGLIRPLWSDEILLELQGSLATRIGDPRAIALIDRLRRHFPEARVSGYQDLIPLMPNHPKDRHVLAAGIHAEAEAVTTFNLTDFDGRVPDARGIEILHPDELLVDLIRSAPRVFLRALESQVAGYRDPRMSVVDLAGALERCGCDATAREIRRRVGR